MSLHSETRDFFICKMGNSAIYFLVLFQEMSETVQVECLAQWLANR